MNRLLMPRATALWLVRHTSLTLTQVSDFCGFHPLEISVLSESRTLQEADPVAMGQLTHEEIQRCEKDPSAKLVFTGSEEAADTSSASKRYVPLSKRAEIPHAVLWIIRHYPQISDARICSFLSVTKETVRKIREGKHKSMKILVPKDPVVVGLCSKDDLKYFLSL
jgi:hypothetical protein